MKPWERFQPQAQQAQGPWTKFQQPQPAAPAQPAQPGPGVGDFVSQGMSGVNEGIADTLGAPVSLATWGINKGIEGINALTHANIPEIQHPVGGQEFFRGVMSPTIKPESDNPALQVTRRVGQEVGAMAIPGMKPIAAAAKPLQMAGKELLAALGSGVGAATAEQVAPGNPIAEIAGQTIGGFSPMAVERAMARGAAKVAPMTTDELRTAKNAAYKAVDQTGVTYTPDAYVNMLTEAGKQAVADHISPTRHAAAFSFFEDMAKRANQPMTITDLDQLRQEVRRDLITPSYGNPAKAADAHFGEIILDSIDNMIAKAGPNDLLSGSGPDANAAILKARDLNTRLRKTELIQDAIEKAKLQAASSGSGGNINNAIRQQIKNILTNPKKVKAYSAEERAAMEALVKQGKADDLIRLLGKAAPGNNGLIGILEVLATFHNPAAAAVPLGGMVAKGFADRKTIRGVEALQQRVATGKPTPKPKGPNITPQQAAIAQALLATQAATNPLQITVHGGSAR